MGLEGCYFVYEVSLLESWGIYKLGGGGGMLSIMSVKLSFICLLYCNYI